MARPFPAVALLLLLAASAIRAGKPPYTPEERDAEYRARGHSWPLSEGTITPDTDGWKAIMRKRFAQLQAIPVPQEKWDGFIQTMGSAVTMENFTEFGWGLTQAPEALTEEMRQAVFDGLDTATPEGKINVIDGPNEPTMIRRPDMMRKALVELQPILEAWSGMELVPSIAYGFRLYHNESRLWMHIDRTQTHVISCIYHIASSDNAKPWPITIEDYEGNTNSVVLKPGDVLLYESAKNFHGRPHAFNGDWYTSVFVHFYPKHNWKNNRDLDGHFAVPPNYNELRDEKSADYPGLRLRGTSMIEPECEDYWCNLKDAIQWEGPGTLGEVMTAGGKRFPLFPDESNEDL